MFVDDCASSYMIVATVANSWFTQDPANVIRFGSSYGVSAGKRDQIEFFFKKKFLSKIDVDLIIWSRIFVISKKIFLSIWSLFPALTPYILVDLIFICKYFFIYILIN